MYIENVEAAKIQNKELMEQAGLDPEKPPETWDELLEVLDGYDIRSADKGVRNRELVVFITPRVMTTAEEIDTQMKEPLRKLQRIERSFDPDAENDNDSPADGATP